VENDKDNRGRTSERDRCDACYITAYCNPELVESYCSKAMDIIDRKVNARLTFRTALSNPVKFIPAESHIDAPGVPLRRNAPSAWNRVLLRAPNEHR